MERFVRAFAKESAGKRKATGLSIHEDFIHDIIEILKYISIVVSPKDINFDNLKELITDNQVVINYDEQDRMILLINLIKYIPDSESSETEIHHFVDYYKSSIVNSTKHFIGKIFIGLDYEVRDKHPTQNIADNLGISHDDVTYRRSSEYFQARIEDADFYKGGVGVFDIDVISKKNDIKNNVSIFQTCVIVNDIDNYLKNGTIVPLIALNGDKKNLLGEFDGKPV